MTDVVIGDDHAVFLDALSSVLADLGCTVTKASTVADTIREVGAHQPDVCLIDGHFAAESRSSAVRTVSSAASGTANWYWMKPGRP